MSCTPIMSIIIVNRQNNANDVNDKHINNDRIIDYIIHVTTDNEITYGDNIDVGDNINIDILREY